MSQWRYRKQQSTEHHKDKVNDSDGIENNGAENNAHSEINHDSVNTAKYPEQP